MTTWLDYVVSPSTIASAFALPLSEQCDLLRSWADHSTTTLPPRRLLMTNLALTLLHRSGVALSALPDSAPPLRTLASFIEVGWQAQDTAGSSPELFFALPAPTRLLALSRWTIQLLPRLPQPDAALEARAPAAEAALGEALARGDDDGKISAELAEWLLASGRSGEAKAFLISALERSPSPRLQALLIATGSASSSPESFPARAAMLIAANDCAQLSVLLQHEALTPLPAACKFRAWREGVAAEALTESIGVLRAYNWLTFGCMPGAPPPPPLPLLAAIEWAMSSAPVLAPRAARLLLSIPRHLLPPREQLPPSIASLLVTPLVPSLPPSDDFTSLPPLPAPLPSAPLPDILTALLATASAPFEANPITPQLIQQLCTAPPSLDSLDAAAATSLVCLLAGAVSVLALGPPDAPMPLPPYGAVASAAATALTPFRDVLLPHASSLLLVWRALSTRLHVLEPATSLPYLVEADAAIESGRLASALAPLLKHWASLSAAFARPLSPATVSDVMWRRAALAATAHGLPIAGAALALFAATPDLSLAARLVMESINNGGGGIVFAEFLTEPSLLELLYSAPGKPKAQILALLARPEASQHNAPHVRAAFVAAKRAACLKKLLSICA